MGKPGAFLDVERKTHDERDVRQTIADFDEFALPLSEELQREQASRCMMCGVAFCQSGIGFGAARTSGCPLHNLIPEWNDLLYRGLWDDAAARLSLTNPFPEFTGRVCPALCETACNLGLSDDATTIRDNERAISDHAWASSSAAVAPLPAPAEDAPRVAVVGSGPAGLTAAWELARLGLRVAVFEKSDAPGGLLMYGIPNMKLPKEVVSRRVELMRESGIAFECGADACDAAVASRLTGGEFDAVVVAAGAGAARTLRCPGADRPGVTLAVDYLTSSTKSVVSGEAPAITAAGLDVVVVGGGDTGTDCVATALRQGAKSVTQLEFLPAPPEERAKDNPWPEWATLKKVDYGQLEAIALQGEDPRLWATNTLEVLPAEVDGEPGGEDAPVGGLRIVSLDWSHGKPEPVAGTERTIDAQLVLIAMGFSGPESAVLQSLGVECEPFRDGVRPTSATSDSEGHRVAATGEVPVFAAGDARSGSSLVVNAIADGLACAQEVASVLL